MVKIAKHPEIHLSGMDFRFVQTLLLSAPPGGADAEESSGCRQNPDRDGEGYFAGGNHIWLPVSFN
jgi:hypothetical protein